MNELLESDLRAALTARFETVAPERELRLRTFDYRSRATRRRRLWAAMGTGGTALTGGVVAAILALSSGASVAEGWTAVPSAPSTAAVAAATAACNWVHDLNGPPILTGTPVLTDGRGSYTAAIYVNGHVAHICISNGQHTATSLAMTDMPLFFDAAPGPDQLGDPDGFGGGGALGFPGSGSSTASSGAEDVSGLAGSEVSAVTFAFADGSSVDATVQNGWYFAWWPGDSWPTSVQVTTSSGTLTSPMAVSACLSEGNGCVFAGRNPHRPSAA
jgi:hypothetical protein